MAFYFPGGMITKKTKVSLIRSKFSLSQSEKTCEATLWETSGTARGSQMLGPIGAQNSSDVIFQVV